MATERRKEIRKHRKEMEDKLFFSQKMTLPDVVEGALLLLKIKSNTKNQNQTPDYN